MNDSGAQGPSLRLATWAAELAPTAVPAEALVAARTMLMDAVGCALSGTLVPTGRIAVQHALAQAGAPDATLIGTAARVPAMHAAFANTMLGRIDLFDDCDSIAHVHAGVATVMASLAVAEREDRDGADFLAAVIVGNEVAVRIGMTVRPAHFDAGYHPTGTLNCFGTAAAAARLMRLDGARTHAAFGLAAEQAAGLTEYRRRGPIEMSAFHGARAAMSGVFAADLAAAGMPAAPAALEGARGMLNVMSPRRDLGPLLDGLGQRYAIGATELKPYPGLRFVHGSIGAVVRLAREDPRFRADNVRSLVIRMARDAVSDCDRPTIATLFDAQYSVQYQTAVALLRGNVTLEDFEPGRWDEPAVKALRQRVRVDHAPEFDARYPDQDTCEAVAVLNDGTVLRRRLDAPPGGPDNPMTAQEITNKFESLAARALPASQVGELRQWMETFGGTTRMRTLGALLRARG